MKYRHAGKEKPLAIGVYPTVELKVARRAQDEAKALLTAGVDPSANKKAQKVVSQNQNSNSFTIVALKWFDT